MILLSSNIKQLLISFEIWGKHTMEITIILSSVTIMAIIILIGMLIAGNYKITDESKQLLVTIIMNISVPSIILNGVFNTHINDQLLSKMFVIFLLSITFNAVGIGLGWLSAIIFGFRTIVAKKIAILAGLGNTGFIGIPVCTTLFGSNGGLLAAIYDAGLDVIVFTLVTILLKTERKFSFRNFKASINIPVIAIMTGVLVAITGYKPPLVIKSLVDILSNLAAPLAMLYVGLLIPSFFIENKKISIPFISISLLMKLLVIPTLMVAVLHTMSITTDVKLVVLIQLSMPTFMLATVLFTKYDGDDKTAVMTTIFSTIFSLMTIPLIAYIGGLLL
jgi:malate permease and related proteins